MKEKILITLATGTTGYATTGQLLKDGYPVRIYVRSRNRRALELEKLGAEIAIGEFNNYRQLKNALNGVERIYYCYPMMKGMPENVRLFIKAAKESNIEAVVFMGQWLAEFDDQKSLLTNNIKESYRLFEESGLNVVYYNPGFFADNVISFSQSVAQLGLMPSPFGKGICPWISSRDLGGVAAVLLENPAPYYGQKVHPTGSKSITAKEMAQAYSKVTGRKVRVMPVPDWLFKKAVIAAAEEFGYDAFVASQTVFYMQELRKDRFAVGGPTDVVKRLTGKEPDDFETIVRDFIENSPYKKRTFSNWLAALKKMMELPFTHIPSKKELEALNR